MALASSDVTTASPAKRASTIVGAWAGDKVSGS